MGTGGGVADRDFARKAITLHNFADDIRWRNAFEVPTFGVGEELWGRDFCANNSVD